MRDQDGFETSAKIRLLHGVNRAFARVFHCVQVEGSVRVPREGPVLIVSNHISSLDPLLIQAVVNRPIVWMVAKEYFDVPFLGWLFGSIRAIPVARDGRDSTAIRAAMRTLAAGRVLGVFPEGRIGRTKPMLPLQTGAAMLAMRSAATVIPVYQSGTSAGRSMLDALLVPQHVTLRFGDALRGAELYGTSPTAETVTTVIETTMLNLARESGVHRE